MRTAVTAGICPTISEAVAAMTQEPLISMQGICKAYTAPVLTGLDLTVMRGDYIAITGKSGAGKSTLLNILGLIEPFDDGEYRLDGALIRPGRDYARLRLREIGFIYQSYQLIPSLSCEENIRLPLLYARQEAENFADLTERLGITTLMKTPVNVLSGGEKQRVAICRALILNPPLIIADEPTGNLDIENRDIVISMLAEENRRGRTVIVITHDDYVASQAKTAYALKGGVLHEKQA